MRFMKSLIIKHRYISPFFINGLFTADPVFFEPRFEWDIFGSGEV